MNKVICIVKKTIQFLHLALVVVLLFTMSNCTPQVQNVSDLNLIPFPKQITMDAGRFSLKKKLQLRISGKDNDILVTQLIEEMKRAGFPEPQLIESDFDMPRLTLSAQGKKLSDPLLPDQAGEGKSDPGEAYSISVTPDGIVCLGNAESGLYYAVQTLRQLIRANTDANGKLPCLTIRDYPSMKYRCFQDDLTRGPSPHIETLLFESDLGAQLKQNMFTYYIEDQFEFKKHPKISPPNGSLLQDELKQLVAFATARHQNILGNQQSFGHHQKTLRIPEYAHLGEAGSGNSPFQGVGKAPYILSPVVEEVYTFLDDLYSEIMPLVPCEMFNVCCDETKDLAQAGLSKKLADKIGVGGVYVQHILRVRELLQKYDKRMLIWGDIIRKYPDILNQIPKDVVMLYWNYMPLTDFDSRIKPFSDAGYEFFVCPGIWNWSVMLPLFNESTVNIRNLVRDGCKHGAIGMLNTGWEDDGEALHGYTWYGIAWGAECSWNAAQTKPEDFRKRIGPVLFGAKGDEFGKAIDLLIELQASTALHTSEFGGGGDVWKSASRNGRFWERDFLPQPHDSISEQNAQKILELVRPAIEYLEKTQKEATVNAELLHSFLLGARRMELIATRMLDGLDVAKRYTALLSLDLSVPENVKKVTDELEAMEQIIQKNRDAHTAIKTEFVRIWNTESKPYSLDWTTKRYDDYDVWFAEIQEKVRNSAKEFKENLILNNVLNQ